MLVLVVGWPSVTGPKQATNDRTVRLCHGSAFARYCGYWDCLEAVDYRAGGKFGLEGFFIYVILICILPGSTCLNRHLDDFSAVPLWITRVTVLQL
jgi:hypothetical protein